MNLPNTGFLRLSQILGNQKSDPPIPAIIPVSKSTWWAGVRDGRFPKPDKLSKRCTAWRVEDIRALIESIHADTILTKFSDKGVAMEKAKQISDLAEIRRMTAEQTEVDADMIKNIER